MISVDEALAAVLANAKAMPPETVSLSAALGRRLAQDIVSGIDVPPYTKSMMDGFAVDAADIAAGVQLAVVEEITAGDIPTKTIQRGQAARIMTGAAIPDGANTVVRFEDTASTAEQVTLNIASENPGKNVMSQGDVLNASQTVLSSGKSLTGLDLGLIAEVASDRVAVHPIPKVAVLATGNELVDAGLPLGRAQIRNSNGPMLSGLVQQSGGVAENLGIGRDDQAQLTRLVSTGLKSDALILSGGVSAGDLDLVPGVLAELGVEQVFHKVCLRPGKPLWFGVYQSAERTVPVFGLPGNPVSSFVCFWLFVRPVLAALSGDSANPNTVRRSRLKDPFEQRGPRETYFPGRIVEHGAEPIVEPLSWKGSADLYTVTQADCLIRFAAGDREFEAGATVDAILI